MHLSLETVFKFPSLTLSPRLSCAVFEWSSKYFRGLDLNDSCCHCNNDGCNAHREREETYKPEHVIFPPSCDKKKKVGYLGSKLEMLTWLLFKTCN